MNLCTMNESKFLCEMRISVEVRALVTLLESWYLGDSEKVSVVGQLVGLCHDVIRMSWLVESKRTNVHPNNEEGESHVIA